MTFEQAIKNELIEVRRLVLEQFEISEKEFCGRGRRPLVVRARNAFVMVAYDQTLASWPNVAWAMKPDGKPYNHSTSITARRRAEQRMKDDPDFAQAVGILEAKFNASRPPRMHRPGHLRIAGAPPPASGPYRVEGEGNPVAVEGGGS